MNENMSKREIVDYIKDAIMNNPDTYRRAIDYRDYYTTRESLGDKIVVAMRCKTVCGEAFSNAVRYACSWLDFNDSELNLAIYELISEEA